MLPNFHFNQLWSLFVQDYKDEDQDDDVSDENHVRYIS